MNIDSAISILKSLLWVSVAICAVPAWAQGQTQDQDLQQLKDKLQKLEQDMEELKGQISKAQQASTPSTPRTTVIVRAEQEAQETPAAAGEQKEKKKNSVDIYGHVMMDSGYEFGRTFRPRWLSQDISSVRATMGAAKQANK